MGGGIWSCGWRPWDAAGRGQNPDGFGSAVGWSGRTIVVGANRDDRGALNSGGAMVYLEEGGEFVEEVFLQSPAPVTGEGFGGSVEAGEGWILVGAPGGGRVSER